MNINKFDVLHHKIIVGKSRNGDVSKLETELENAINEGVKIKCPQALDFIKRKTPVNEKPLKTFILKHRDWVENLTLKPYTLIKWFMAASMVVAVIIEQGAYQYVA
jgi:hypothetical protein